tara:strand:- start:82 stop:1011 length:930 start_codon:yes stop_codon:yes gene_type:complete
MAQSGLLYKFEQTNLDLESPLPEGGPINVPRFNHTQKYAPNLTYLNFSTWGGNGSGFFNAASSQISGFGIEGEILKEKNIFNQTNLDVLDSSPDGGPIDVPRFNHKQKYTPNQTYLNIGTWGGNGSGLFNLSNSPLSDFGIEGETVQGESIFEKTNLDVENPLVDGGPINVPVYNHEQKYTPQNTYLDNFGEQRSNNSAFGIEDTTLQPGNIFEESALDVTSDLASVVNGTNGGPNRFDPNRFNTVGNGDGKYINYKASTNPATPLPSKGTPLTTKEDKESISILQAYSPTNTYLESISTYKSDNNNKI